jgi:hypothetical protein
LRRGGKRKDRDTLYLKMEFMRRWGSSRMMRRREKQPKKVFETSGQGSKPMDDCDDDLGYMGEPLHDEVSCVIGKIM